MLSYPSSDARLANAPTMRLFTALDLPDALRDACATYADRLRDAFIESEISVRWTDPVTYHTTIRFIGECSEDEAEIYTQVLEEGLTDVSLPANAGVELNPYGLGVLPTRLSPRVLMVGLQQTRSIATLYKTVTTALEGAGLDEADNSFRPHVTLARLDDKPDPEEVYHILRNIDPVDTSAATVPHLTLFKSENTSEGVRHEGLRQFDLTV